MTDAFNNKEYLTTTELAEVLGISRIAVFQKIQEGLIPAKQSGRNYLIAKKDVEHLTHGVLRSEDKDQISAAVKKTVEEYGETLRLLGKE